MGGKTCRRLPIAGIAPALALSASGCFSNGLAETLLRARYPEELTVASVAYSYSDSGPPTAVVVYDAADGSGKVERTVELSQQWPAAGEPRAGLSEGYRLSRWYDGGCMPFGPHAISPRRFVRQLDKRARFEIEAWNGEKWEPAGQFDVDGHCPGPPVFYAVLPLAVAADVALLPFELVVNVVVFGN